MRLLPGFSLALVLSLLLIGTTPMGTGTGAHQFDLLHPLFAHVHLVNGQVVTHDQIEQARVGLAPTHSSPGPAIGAGSAANPSPGGLGISPVMPSLGQGPVPGLASPRLVIDLHAPAGRLQERPPHPPPTSAA